MLNTPLFINVFNGVYFIAQLHFLHYLLVHPELRNLNQ